MRLRVQARPATPIYNWASLCSAPDKRSAPATGLFLNTIMS